MDTIDELRAAQWWEDHLETCGTCEWKDHGYCTSMRERNGEWVEDNDGCEDWIEYRDPRRKKNRR